MIEVEVPDVGVVEFPDDTANDVIERQVRNAHVGGQLQKERAQYQKPFTPQSLASFGNRAIDIEAPVLDRLSLGGLGRIAGAVSKDILSQGASPVFSLRATASELMGEPTPPDIQAPIEQSGIKSGLVDAASFFPTIGASMVLPGSPFITGPLAFGAEGFERGGAEGDIGAGVVEGGKQAAIGAALPLLGGAGRLIGGATTAALVNRGVGGAVLANPAVQKAIELGASQAAIQLPFVAHVMASDEYKNATPAEKRRILTETVVSGLVLGGPEVLHAVRSPRSAASRFENLDVQTARALDLYQTGDVPLELPDRSGIGTGPTRLSPHVLPGGAVLPGDSLVARPRDITYVDPGAQPIIPVTRNVRTDEGGGQVSFGAEAPTLLRNAPEGAITTEDVTPAVDVSTPNQNPVAGLYRRPGPPPTSEESLARSSRESVERGITVEQIQPEYPAQVGQYPEQGPTGTLSRSQRRKLIAQQERAAGIRPGSKVSPKKSSATTEEPSVGDPIAEASREWSDAVSAIDSTPARELDIRTLDSASQALERMISILERNGLPSQREYRLLEKADNEINRRLKRKGESEFPSMVPGGVGRDPIPEAPAALAEQLRLTADPKSSKAATLFTPGEALPNELPEGLMTVKGKHGTIVFNPDKINATDVHAADSGDMFDATILGQAGDGSEPVQGKNVVTTHTDAAKNVITEIVPDNDPAAIKAATEAQQAAVPGGTTEIKPAIQVAKERIDAKNQIQETGGTPPVEPQPAVPSPEGQAETGTPLGGGQGEAKVAPAPEGAEGKPKDAIETWLEKKIAEQPDSGPGIAYSMPMFSPTIYLRAALSFYRAGRTVAQAVDEAVDMAKKRGLTSGEEARFRAFITAGMPSISPAPPMPASVLPPGLGTPATARPLKTLEDAKEHFKPGKKAGRDIGGIPEAVWNKFVEGTVQEYRPLTVLENKIFKALGIKRPYVTDYASWVESLAGSGGQARGDINTFERDMKPLLKGIERDDFNSYLLAERVKDRNNQQARTGKLRTTGDWSNADADNVLGILERKYGPERWRALQQAGAMFNGHMDQALHRMVTSGRMSQETYNEIKDANSFYAPYVMMKYIAERELGAGTGRQIDTQAELTKRIRGITDKEFKLDDMMTAGRAQIARSRILAEKSLRMQRFHGLKAADPTGQFIREVDASHKPGEGMDVVVAMENGKPIHYEVPKSVAAAVEGMNRGESDVLVGILRGLNKPFKMGATAYSLGFQMVNAPLDQARMATMSKVGFGSGGVTDIYRYLPDVFRGAWESAVGNRLLPRLKSQKHQEFLASGAAGSNPIAQFDAPLSEGALRTPGNIKRIAGDTVGYVARAGQAIEEATKMAGFLRALRISGLSTGEDLLRLRPDLVTEIRRYAGSPDFSRAGKWVRRYHLNEIFAFSNARIQGQMDDIARLFNLSKPKDAAIAAARLSAFIGIPTATLWAVNHSPGVKDDYDKIAAREKDDYFHYPKFNADGSGRYITNAKGDKVRDWFRFPKKDIVQHFANMVEAGLDSYAGTDPKGTRSFIASAIENAIPVNITGKNARERMESVAASTGPLQSLYTIASGRNAYTHRDVVQSAQQRIGSPEEQYNPGTPELYKRIAHAMPKWAPDFARSPLMVENLTKNLTANLIDQFVPRTGIEGRSGAENWRIFRRFQGSGYEDNPEFRDEMDKLHRESADEYLHRDRAVDKIFKDNPDTGDAIRAAISQFGGGKDKKALDRFREKLRERSVGTTPEDRQLLGLSPDKRAEYIAKQISKMDRGATLSYLRQLSARKVLSPDTIGELKRIQMEIQPAKP